jgi:hypothetical protein
MKPLSDEKKKNIFNDIVKSIKYINTPTPGEFTITMIYDAMDKKVSKDKIRHKLYTLEDAGLLERRKITQHGSRAVAYRPVRDASYEEILEILLES